MTPSKTFRSLALALVLSAFALNSAMAAVLPLQQPTELEPVLMINVGSRITGQV